MPRVTGTSNAKNKSWHLGKADFCAEPIHRYCRKNTFLLSQSFWKRIQKMIGFTTTSTIWTEDQWCEWGMLQFKRNHLISKNLWDIYYWHLQHFYISLRSGGLFDILKMILMTSHCLVTCSKIMDFWIIQIYDTQLYVSVHTYKWTVSSDFNKYSWI